MPLQDAEQGLDLSRAMHLASVADSDEPGISIAPHVGEATSTVRLKSSAICSKEVVHLSRAEIFALPRIPDAPTANC
jgi:hypothetical protein